MPTQFCNTWCKSHLTWENSHELITSLFMLLQTFAHGVILYLMSVFLVSATWRQGITPYSSLYFQWPNTVIVHFSDSISGCWSTKINECTDAWMEVVTASISHLSGYVSNCGKKKLGSYNWLLIFLVKFSYLRVHLELMAREFFGLHLRVLFKL